MCAPLGVDPMSSEKSFWGKVLGMGDFYHELAVKVAEVCSASRSTNGGIMSVKEVQAILAKRKTRLGTASAAATVSASDIEIAIQKLGKLGGGFRTIKVGKSSMIVSVPNELDGDIMRVMAVGNEGFNGITVDDIMVATQWSRDRSERTVQLLLQEGMAWLDTYKGENYYWFPSMWQEEREKMKEQFM